ncbi:hypothetical protein FSARC_12883 [Fusarium sarcochroum]|uniref:Uncharacterized protein n=1 Tax=Fusarium sarcochroum TaxID=1208366 RepID=A0A8H4T5F7_9HYPO|nr:hypothetical protein FSARC_12883 [Fusarium sarcochroum]
MNPHVTPPQETTQSLDLLDDDRRHTLNQAVRNVLNTEVAEHTYAQILDGLPTEKSLTDSFPYFKDRPVYAINHVEICPGYIERAREFRKEFNLSQLQFEPKTLTKFQDADSGSYEYNLRLIELVVVACHQIGAYLFELDDGAHKHEYYQDWRDKVLEEKKNGVESRKYYKPPPIAFSHRSYRSFQQYPRGFADVAGYWAESKIFGGVVVFDRGESELECKSMWIHGDLVKGPKTLYPPSKEQFDALLNFFTSPKSEDSSYPFPIHGTRTNRPRWHPYHAFAHHHIFRDRFERKLPSRPPQPGCVESGVDWPELEDQQILMLANFTTSQGDSYNSEDEVAAAKERIRNITPSSPLWGSFGNSNTF